MTTLAEGPEGLAAVTGVLRALQFGDSMFPVGGFSFSNGVETALAEGTVHDAVTLSRWVRAATRNAATGDGVAVLHAHRAALRGDLDGVAAADRAVYVRKLNEETRTMTVRTGRKLAEAAARIVPGPMVDGWLERISTGQTAGCYPAGLGVSGVALGLAETDVFAMHQYSLAATMVGAAVRLLPLHHLAAQEVLFEVNGHCAGDYQTARGRELADMSGFAPQVDVLAAVHVRAHVRMFMN
ncbi:urease accessory protein UreF [Catellatospora methionotrophica]|uniref:Urease accessory protein UreF n=1 Tax=Catellatospora methionotrophica TaxID=121620 RepID=A0A8J3PIW8_9ACTN|nr:urease accessory protein UreF [Catellatospora methionotrophica]GIG18184.1 urease accessory protein UreF [Catellatospora methionotrophica]